MLAPNCVNVVFDNNMIWSFDSNLFWNRQCFTHLKLTLKRELYLLYLSLYVTMLIFCLNYAQRPKSTETSKSNVF